MFLMILLENNDNYLKLHISTYPVCKSSCYRGLKNWEQERGWLTDTVLTAQDRFKAYLDYFQIKY